MPSMHLQHQEVSRCTGNKWQTSLVQAILSNKIESGFSSFTVDEWIALYSVIKDVHHKWWRYLVDRCDIVPVCYNKEPDKIHILLFCRFPSLYTSHNGKYKQNTRAFSRLSLFASETMLQLYIQLYRWLQKSSNSGSL